MTEKGIWTVRVGIDAQTFYGSESFEVGHSMPWTGL
jgi:beta-glucosidase